MLVVHVHVQVKEQFIEAFIVATKKNAAASLTEPGIARFDVVQERDQPARFVLIEAYKSDDAAAAHKETAHYLVWRDQVAEMMAAPRSSVKYESLAPDEESWG
jgi:quinol monooxygenase YgiN